MKLGMLLPALSDAAHYARLRPRTELWLPALRAICVRHGIAAEPLEQFLPMGTHVVFAAGRGHVVKLFAPFWNRDFSVEACCARAVRHLGVALPEVVAQGEIEGWPYLVVRRIPGVLLERAWPGLDARSRAVIAEALGRFAAELHRLPLLGLEALSGDWEGFVRQQRAGCFENQRARGMGEAWLREIPEFLAHALGPAAPARRVLLHADLCDDNLLVREEAGRIRLAVLDFADARIGDPEYEFAATSLFLAAEDGSLQRAFLGAYGYAASDLDEDLALRLTALLLLHRYVHLPVLLGRLGPPEPRGPGELARRLWPFFRAGSGGRT